MRSTSGPTSITLAKSAILVAILFVMAPALYAQSDEVLYLGNTRTVQPTFSNLTDPGPIGAETTTSLYFGQVALGAGWNTIFSIVNTGATTVNGTLTITGANGSANQCQYRWDGYFCTGCVGSLRRHPDTDRQSSFGDRSIEGWLGPV